MEKKETRNELEAKLISKALKNESFRKELLEDPKAAIKKELGVEIPDNINIKVIEEKENEVCLVLPAYTVPEAELSEAELEATAGGWTGFTKDCGSCATEQCGTCDPIECRWT